MAKVSLIMAAYNSEKYIAESIESIIQQTYIDWELIICDDFSDDSTFAIIKEYANLDERIVILRNSENKKAAYSRNRCIEIATGEFIAIQDADDISLISRLEKQVYFLNNNPSIDFVGTARKSFNEMGVFTEKILKKRPVKKDFLINFPFVHASIMFREPVIRVAEGYRVAKETVRGQDADMIMRIYSKGYVGANLEQSLYLYREGIAAEKRRSLKRRLDAVKVRYKRFKEMGLMPIGYLYIFLPVLSVFIPVKMKKIIKNIKTK